MTEKCGCYVGTRKIPKTELSHNLVIEYCPTHAAAPEMLAALEDALQLCNDIVLNGNVDWEILGAIANMLEKKIAAAGESE